MSIRACKKKVCGGLSLIGNFAHVRVADTEPRFQSLLNRERLPVLNMQRPLNHLNQVSPSPHQEQFVHSRISSVNLSPDVRGQTS